MESEIKFRIVVDSLTDEEFLCSFLLIVAGGYLFCEKNNQYCMERFIELQRRPSFFELLKKVGW